MKRSSVLRPLLIGALTLFVVPAISWAAITGSPHDFKGQSWSGGEICVVCHTPHNAGANTVAPLWNHETTIETFTVYGSDSLDATVGQPTGNALACLSCHDGSVAINSFGGNTGAEFIAAASEANLGNSLANDHPVSFAYDSALATADGGLKDPTTLPTTVRLFGASGTLQCASCHDVHKSRGFSPSSDHLLVVNNAGSALCLTCHSK